MINFVITLKWVLLVITLTQASADDTHGIEKRGTNGDSKKVVCYYTNWSVYRPGTAKFSPQNINPYLCTHLIYAFGGLDKENGLRPYDKYQDIEQGGYAKFTGLKTYNKNLKTMLAIGGWNEGSSRFSALVADEDRRAIFVKNVVKFLRQNNFDGLDLDWEYPAFRDGSKPADKDNYASLVKELREEFDKESSKTGRPRLLLTMAVPAGVEYIDKGYDVPKLNKYLDFMNILSYDYHSAYEPNVNHHSPLYSLQEESEYNFDAQLTIDHTVKHFLKKGADREKLVLGIPTYGRSYTLFNPDSADLGSPADGPGEQGEATREKGYLAYYEICGNLENDKQWKVVQPKKSAMGPYAYRGNQWVSYDDADIVRLKAKYVNEKGLGGIMYWSIDNDDFRGKCHGKPYPLIEAGKESLLASSGSSINSISATGEEKRSKLGGKRNRPKSQNLNTTTKQPSTTTSTTTTTSNPLSTPEPPTTPDPGTDFVCKEEGFFPHPRDCKKYFWCLDSGPSNLGIVAHQFTCPSGLMFNKAADSCDYSRNVICNKKSEKTAATTTTTIRTTSLASTTNKPGTTTTTTTTTTTEAPAVEEDYEEEDADSQEDPKAIKQLITLIKKLGGIAELEKQLKLEDGLVEVTTPAISKNLYNKVFSAPSTSRFKTQYRNGPSGPQHEGIASNDDVPYYKKDKPQYVTIQRSRPLKNIPQDTEDSGTTNNKSVQPNKYQETTDYVDDVTEGETTTVKYSSPRFRSSGADSRTTSLKYVVLERNKPDRTTTSDEELTAESPSSTTTQRYITLVRQRPSTAATEYEEEITNTEPSTQRTSQKFHSRYETEERVTEKPKEKVSEIETTAYLPVTSAQNHTDRPQTLSTAEYAETTTVIPSTYSYLVFPQKNDEILKKADDISTIESRDLETYVTEAYIPSTLTTIITTIRESATEKARISLRRYKEYLKSNKTDILSELRSNYIFTKKSKERSTTESISTSETFNGDFTPTTRRTGFSRKRTNYTLPTTENSKSTSTENAVHSRFFIRRNKGTTSSTTITEASTNSSSESTTRSFLRKTTKSSESSEESGEILKTESDESTPKYKSRYRPKYQSSTPPESDSISSFFKKRRLSTTEKSVEFTTSASSKVSSRYFSRNRKTSPQTTETTSTEDSPLTTKYVKSNAFRKTTQSEILDSDENRYEIPERTTIPIESNTQLNFDAFETWTKNASLESNTSSRIESTTKQTISSNHSTTVNNVTNRFNEISDNSTTNTNRFDASITERASSKNDIEPISEAYPKTFRNNSRFLKNPEPEYNVYSDGTKVNRIRGQAKYSADEKVHRFSSPIYVVQKLHDNQIEYPHRNEFRVKVTKKIPSSRGRALEHVEDSENAQTVQRTRGTKKFVDQLNNAVNTVVENSTTIIKTENRSARGRSRLVNSNFSTPSSPEIETRKRIRPPIVATDSYENESRGRPRVYTASPIHVTSTYVTETRARSTVQETTTPTIGKDVKSRRRSRVQNFNTLNTTENVKQRETPSTQRVPIRSRGKIKAQNSLSQAEIRELVTLAEAPAEVKPRKKPKTIVEETFITNNDKFGYSNVITIPDIQERSFEETTDTIYVLDGNSITTEYYENVKDNDVFRVSETKYANEKFVSDSQDIKKLHSTSDAAESTMATEQTEEPPSRYRENFRRTTSPRSRSRSTTTTTTTTEHIPSNESSKLSSRFRRRKIKPENRSISTGRTENFVSSTYQGEVSTSRPKNVDISQRGSTTISDYLPVPAPLYGVNHSSNLDRYNIDTINLEDLEAQTINTQTSYYNTEDVSDLADPAVVAIHNLKTLPPASSQVTITKPAVPIASHIKYAEEVSLKPYSRIKSTPTTTVLPFSKSRTSIRRGTVRLSTKATTTTQIPSLQDIYNDYHETDVEYHADPVEIPITGKVRIHSDGYIECLDMGNFPHPFSCKKFISCAKMEYDSLLGWEYTCPKGLSFDPIGGICNWAAGLGCKE